MALKGTKMKTTHVVGVDPGIVHTGVVDLVFRPELKSVTVQHMDVVGPDAAAVNQFPADAWGNLPENISYERPDIYIEGYRPRSNLQHDARMTQAVAEIRQATRGTVLLNTGIKKVVRRP